MYIYIYIPALYLEPMNFASRIKVTPSDDPRMFLEKAWSNYISYTARCTCQDLYRLKFHWLPGHCWSRQISNMHQLQECRSRGTEA